MRLVYITLARKILCYGSFPAKVSLGTNAYNSLKISQTYFLPTENPFKNQAKSADKNRYAGTVFVRPGIFHARITELYKCSLVFFSA